MGLIISRFRKKQSTKEILEQIQKDVLEIEEYHVHTQQRQKRLVGSLVLYSIVLYLVAAAVFYFYYFPSTTQDQLLYATPFIVFPLVVYIFKRLLTWYYRRKIAKNEQKLKSLRERKTQILEQVMETETYKVAKEILEIYAPDQLHRSQMHKTPAVIGPAPQRLLTPSGSHPDVRRRIVAPMSTPQNMAQPPRPMGSQNLPHQTPVFPVRPALNSQNPPSRPGLTGMGTMRSTPAGLVPVPTGPGIKYSATPAQSHHASLPRPGLGPVPGLPSSEGPPGPPMPRPVLPRERGYLDRFVEYLVGDGPANRFALVCRQCESHNGMALKDEFPYLAFRCAYCFYWNPARKQRPFAPRLETITPQLPPPIPTTEDQEEEEEEDEEEEEQEEQESSSGEDEEEEEEGGVEEEESASSSSAEEEEEEEEGAVSSSELSSHKATSSQEGVCRPQQAGSLEDVAKSTPSSDPSSSDDHQNFVEVFFTSSASRTTHTMSTSASASKATSLTSSSNATSMTETEETE